MPISPKNNVRRDTGLDSQDGYTYATQSIGLDDRGIHDRDSGFGGVALCLGALPVEDYGCSYVLCLDLVDCVALCDRLCINASTFFGGTRRPLDLCAACIDSGTIDAANPSHLGSHVDCGWGVGCIGDRRRHIYVVVQHHGRTAPCQPTSAVLLRPAFQPDIAAARIHHMRRRSGCGAANYHAHPDPATGTAFERALACARTRAAHSVLRVARVGGKNTCHGHWTASLRCYSGSCTSGTRHSGWRVRR